MYGRKYEDKNGFYWKNYKIAGYEFSMETDANGVKKGDNIQVKRPGGEFEKL